MEIYFLNFCRIVIGIAFSLSFVTKLRGMTEFKQTVQNFQILAYWLVTPFSWLFLAGEFVVVGLMVVGGSWLRAGFILAALLLFVFSMALTSVLVRKIRTHCNCFGASTRPISFYDVGRNMIFIVLSLWGWQLYLYPNNNVAGSNPLEMVLIGVTALVFVLVVINLDELVRIFK